jgi:hypothetical protein
LHCCNTPHAIEKENWSHVRSSLVIQIADAQDQSTIKEPAKTGKVPAEGRGNMDELVGRLAAEAGIDGAMSEETIGIVLGFLRNEAVRQSPGPDRSDPGGRKQPLRSPTTMPGSAASAAAA